MIYLVPELELTAELYFTLMRPEMVSVDGEQRMIDVGREGDRG